ncbi:hypothetical protein ACOMHN_037955 [Nucella lapillus]
MASLVRMTVGTLNSALYQAASLTSRSLAFLPRLISTANLPRSPTTSTITTTTTTPSLPPPLTTTPNHIRHFSLLTSSRSGIPPTSLLQNVHQFSPAVGTQSRRSYHVRVALRRRCRSCFFVRRKGRLFVECKAKPRHKQMQVMSKRKTWKEDYSEGFIQRAVHWKYDRDYRYYKLGDTPFARHDWLKGKIGVTV